MLITNPDTLQYFLEESSDLPLAFDTETSGVKLTHGDVICGISLAYRSLSGNIHSCYIPIRHKSLVEEGDVFSIFEDETVENMDPDTCIQLLKPVLENKDRILIAHNAKFDITAFLMEGINITNVEDTMILFNLLNPGKRMGLKKLMESILGEPPVETDELKKWIRFHGQSKDVGFQYVPIELITPYAEKDAIATLRIWEELNKQGIDEVRNIYSLEKRVIPVLARLQVRGLPASLEVRNEILNELIQDIKKVEEKIYELAGKVFELNNPETVANILYSSSELGIEIPRVSDEGVTDEKSLSRINHPIAKHIISYRKLEKMRGTYVEPLINHIVNNRVHTKFNQIKTYESSTGFSESKARGTDTGRLSSEDPNLQNIAKPIVVNVLGKEKEYNLRCMFRFPDEDLDKWQLILIDYSNIELRIVADLSNEDSMIEGFLNGIDQHKLTASQVFGIPFDEVTKEQRSAAKAINFGLIYGMTPARYAKDMGISVGEAKEYFRSFFKAKPKIQEYNEYLKSFARTNGYVKTKYGRKRILKPGEEYKALNTVIQGTAGDLNKISLVRVEKALSGKKSMLINNIHDEHTMQHYKEELDAPKLMKEAMESFNDFKVPIVVDCAIAWPSWGDKRELTQEEHELYGV